MFTTKGKWEDFHLDPQPRSGRSRGEKMGVGWARFLAFFEEQDEGEGEDEGKDNFGPRTGVRGSGENGRRGGGSSLTFTSM